MPLNHIHKVEMAILCILPRIYNNQTLMSLSLPTSDLNTQLQPLQADPFAPTLIAFALAFPSAQNVLPPL